MRIAFAIGAVVAALCAAAPSRAQTKDACTKDCRDYYKACVQAHSQGACKSELDICMKHCRQK